MLGRAADSHSVDRHVSCYDFPAIIIIIIISSSSITKSFRNIRHNPIFAAVSPTSSVFLSNLIYKWLWSAPPLPPLPPSLS